MIFKIGILEIDLKDIVIRNISDNYRAEALEIVYNMLYSKHNSSNVILTEFIIYDLKDMRETLMIHLDYMKYNLIKWGIMNNIGEFGRPWTDEMEPGYNAILAKEKMMKRIKNLGNEK